MSRRKRGMILWIILSMVLVLAMAVGIYVFFPEWIPECFKGIPPYRAVASGNVISLEAESELPKSPLNQITLSEITAAIENNYHDNFQSCFQAEAAYVVDEYGEVLFAQNEHSKLYPASTTKMMTAYLALMYTEDLDAWITVDELTGCYETDSWLIYLKPGDRISMRDLLYALLMCSYNDAATAIAMEIGGSLEGFAEMMNTQLAEIGAEETHFVTPHGLHDEDHYTTAYDLNLILQMACEVESLREIMMTEEVTIEIYRGDETLVYDLENSSFFLKGAYDVPTMEYVGGKTGYTEKAGSCLASVFEYEDTWYYSTIMKTEDAPYMTTMLFDYYFAPEELAAFSATIPLMRD